MIKRTLLFILLALIVSNTLNVLAQTTVDVRSNGFDFSPDEIHIAPGDTIDFNIGSFHDAVEVSEETWNANDTTYNGGFRFPLGGGLLVLEELGTYYFVCTPHASLGMKGIIYVEEPSLISSYIGDNDLQFRVFPNPASETINFSFEIENTSFVNIEMTDITGRVVNVFVNETYQPGIYNEIYNIDNIQPGRYMVYIRTETGNTASSLIILE